MTDDSTAATRQFGDETAGTEPVADSRSKQVMLRAERHDTVEIVGWESPGPGENWPHEFTVAKRNETYYGPCLVLHAEVDGEDQNYRLTCPGPNTHLLLWASLTDNEGFRHSWHPIAEVRATIADVEQYNICDHCGEPLRNQWHERLSAIGACGNVDDPNGGGSRA